MGKYILLVTVLFLLVSAQAVAIGNTITYQGELQDTSVLADGQYDFTFELYDAVTDGSAVVPLVMVEAVEVTAGVFSVELDFGDMAFLGDQLWLEIAVRHGDNTGAHQVLDSRQKITAAPYALHAEMVAMDAIGGDEIINGSITGVDIAANSIDATDIVDGSGSNLDADLLDGLDSTEFASQSQLSNMIDNLQSQIDDLQNQPPHTPKILGISNFSSTGKFFFNNIYGVQAANEMCIASYPSTPSAHFCDISEINRAVAAENYGTGTIDEEITWTVAHAFETAIAGTASLYNSCQGLMENAGDVAKGVRLTIDIDYLSVGNGGGVVGDVVNLETGIACFNNYPVMCCE